MPGASKTPSGTPSGPVGVIEAAELFKRFENTRHLAVAVSGGADSVALMWLMARWRGAGGGNRPVLSVLSVDHGLRAASAGEADQVGLWARNMGFEHHVMRWQGVKPESSVQARARAARYRLMARWCRKREADGLVLAHHLDDQAETVLMRLGRGSGLDGLCGMRSASWREGVLFSRPLLDIPKERLVATLKVAGQPWLEDPSNQDLRFERVRIRRVLAQIDDAGITARALCQSAKRLAKTRDALDGMADALFKEAGRFSPAGWCRMDLRKMQMAEHETGLRLFRRVLLAIGGGQHPPAHEKLLRLYERVVARGGAGATLAGCRVFEKAGELWVVREMRGKDFCALELAPGGEDIWDNRFAVTAPDDGGGCYQVRMLGDEGWKIVKNQVMQAKNLPAAAGRGMVSFWRGGELVAVPHFEFYPANEGRFTARFIQKQLAGLTD